MFAMLLYYLFLGVLFWSNYTDNANYLEVIQCVVDCDCEVGLIKIHFNICSRSKSAQ